MTDERRIAYIRLRARDVVDLLMGFAPNIIERLRVPGLPADYKILHVGADMHSHCILVLVEHPSFAAVPEGEQIPMIPDVFERYVLARVEDESDPPVYREVR